MGLVLLCCALPLLLMEFTRCDRELFRTTVFSFAHLSFNIHLSLFLCLLIPWQQQLLVCPTGSTWTTFVYYLYQTLFLWTFCNVVRLSDTFPQYAPHHIIKLPMASLATIACLGAAIALALSPVRGLTVFQLAFNNIASDPADEVSGLTWTNVSHCMLQVLLCYMSLCLWLDLLFLATRLYHEGAQHVDAVRENERGIQELAILQNTHRVAKGAVYPNEHTDTIDSRNAPPSLGRHATPEAEETKGATGTFAVTWNRGSGPGTPYSTAYHNTQPLGAHRTSSNERTGSSKTTSTALAMVASASGLYTRAMHTPSPN